MPYILLTEDETFEFNLKGQKKLIRQGRERSRVVKGVEWKKQLGKSHRSIKKYGILRFMNKKCQRFMMHVSVEK